jgi:hypothetical protein
VMTARPKGNSRISPSWGAILALRSLGDPTRDNVGQGENQAP